MNVALVIVVWAIGTLLAHRLLVRWMGVLECWGEEPIDYLMAGVCLFLAAVTWPAVLAGGAILAAFNFLADHIGVNQTLRRWVRWFYAPDRESRKGALAK